MKTSPSGRRHSTPQQVLTQLQAYAAGILAEGVVLSSFKHKGLSGIEREEPVRRFLRNHLPGRFHVGQGAIASSKVMLDHQHDIIVADRDLCFMLLNTLNAQLLAVESIHVIVEVRSRANELDDVAKSFRNVRNLRANRGLRQLGGLGSDQGVSPPPVHTIVFYQGPKRPETLIKKIADVNSQRSGPDGRMTIDFALVLAATGEQTPSTGYLIGYTRTDEANGLQFSHHLYPKSGEDGLEGPKVIRKGGDSFARWYAGILHHLIGVIAYPPIMYNYLGDSVSFLSWDRKPN